MAVASITMIPVAFLSHPILVVLCMAVCNFSISSVMGPSWAVSMDVAGGFSGSVSSVMNMVGQAAGSVSAILFGILVQRGSWTLPFFITSGVMLLSCLLWAFAINPDKPVVKSLA
jgi:predicted MFS family arabinose efflux permease